jgi:MarR family transcriptional regulator, organic hydroperoxide resistance regulator
MEDALTAHRVVHRALLNAKSHRWRDIDITMQQLRAIYLLRDEGEVTVSRLAEMFDMGLPAASLLADRLVRAGLVERGADAGDRRRVLLRLTRAGDRLVTELREGSQALLRRWLATLPAGDLAALSRGWKALAEVASRHGQPFENAAI